MLLYKSSFDTPIGNLLGISTEYGLFSLTFQEDDPTWISTRVLRYFNINQLKMKDVTPGKSKILGETDKWINHYFSGQFSKLKLPPLDLQGTAFEIMTWKSLIKIPVGKTDSYGKIAAKIRKPTAQRAVGRAIGRNPIALLVPCHRIIGANGALTGFRGGLDRKIWLLAHETP